jgi:hypothetical protein
LTTVQYIEHWRGKKGAALKRRRFTQKIRKNYEAKKRKEKERELYEKNGERDSLKCFHIKQLSLPTISTKG